MQIDKLSDHWLFERHSKQAIKEWLRHLRYFHYKRAWGGHANDGDEFQVAFTLANRLEVKEKLRELGLTVNSTSDDEQPGWSKIFGHEVFIWIHKNSINITISGTKDGNHYEVTEGDFKVCLELEKQFESLGWQTIIDTSFQESVCCISQAKYPELYD